MQGGCPVGRALPGRWAGPGPQALPGARGSHTRAQGESADYYQLIIIISICLRAIKSAHEPVIVGLAGMVQEQPGTGLAGIDQAEICLNMQRIISYM